MRSAWTQPLLLTLALSLGVTGCKLAVFDRPVMVSTRSSAVARAQPIGRVTAKRCNYVVLIIPIVRDPKAAYEELLEKAETAGGNVVVDFQVRDAGFVSVIPFFTRACWEATGIAAKL